MQGYRISTDTAGFDLQVIHNFLRESYWAKGIPLATVSLAIRNSLCFGVFTESGQHIGFARIITDHATFA